jgi:hypothetical protein
MPQPAKLRAFACASVSLVWVCFGFAQTSQPTSVPGPRQAPNASAIGQPPVQPTLGSIHGTVLDPSGALVSGARITLIRGDQSQQQTQSDTDGQFSFTNVPSGPFQLTIASPGFSTQTSSGTLDPGEVDTLNPIMLAVASTVTEVQVALTRVEVAEEQIKVEEKQRVLGAIPNFYVTYNPNAEPLTSKQKFKLAARSVIDPFTFVVVAGSAGIEQWQGHFIGYGQGTEGYAKRFGANYADTVSGTFIGGAILPSLLKQDPRYFYKGTGGIQARALYAIANAVICKGDNRRWQPNYSNVLGNLAAGGISNIYYPAQDRNGAELTFVNAAIGIASNAVSNLLQEFLIRKLTPSARNRGTDQP